MKHLTSILLLTSLLAVSMISCGGDSTTPTVTNAVTTSAVPAETEAVRITANLPERDFGGEEFTFYGRIYAGGDWSADDILIHSADGDTINDAVYERTVYIEDTYNVKLGVIESQNGSIGGMVKPLLLAGDTSFQAIVSAVVDAGGWAAEHLLWDLNEVGNLDLTQEWWSQKANSTMSLANKQYYVTGDIFIVDNQAIRMVFFNKDMIEEFDLESPYTLVRNNEWTIEKLVEYSETVQGDLNGDNTFKPGDDRFGTMAQGSFGSVLYYASGNTITAKDKDDLPYIACNTDAAMTVMSGISQLISSCDAILMSNENTSTDSAWPDNVRHFMDGRVLFAPEVLLLIELARNCPVDIGMLPPPKYDASQDGYYCFADNWCPNVVSIPITNAKPDDAGFIIEAMAADSMNNLTPAYYEVALTEKYARDKESVEMLDLILDSMVLDNANIFGWGGMEGAVGTAINEGNAIASTIEKRISATEKQIAKTVEKFTAEE
ncbi:MAG: hypothetical protein E7604_01705 [Ruminococcaceae bacterium]|nr:hypothetical protein [Oscillospiraceae bacterium]